MRRKEQNIENDIENDFFEKENEIVMPSVQVTYKRVPVLLPKKKFEGETTPIPKVLIQYLKDYELKAFAIIFDQIRATGRCMIRMETFAKIMGVTTVSVMTAIKNMRHMGIIQLTSYGRLKDKQIDFAAIQRLEDLLKDKRPGAAAYLRRRAGIKNVKFLTETLIGGVERLYGSTDETEYEEYD